MAGRIGTQPAGRSMGGWILAELTMVLVMVVLGSQFIAAAPTPTPSPVPGGSATPTQPIQPTTPAPPRGITQDYQECEVIMANASDSGAAQNLHDCIMTKGEGRRPGLILLFGVSWDRKRPTSGEMVSEPMAALLRPMFGDDVPAIRALMRSTNNHQPGKVMAEIFYYSA